MAAELVNSATSEKLKEMDWMRNIDICELVSRDQGKAKDVIKTVKKRLGNKNPNVQLFAVMLLEMLMNNCGDHIHKQVIENGVLPILVKIVKKKSVKINLCNERHSNEFALSATDRSASTRENISPPRCHPNVPSSLQCARLQFPQNSRVSQPEALAPKADANNLQVSAPPNCQVAAQQPSSQTLPDSSIIQKAASALEVLRDVLDAIDPRHPEGATDEFTLDLVEQCSFQKQRVMHLVMTSRDEKVVSQAIELNEQLQKVLTKHDALLSVHPSPTVVSFDNEGGEEEEADSLFRSVHRRIRKGKACAEDQSDTCPRPMGPFPGEMLNRPLIRPLCLEPPESNGPSPAASIPPPPSKHIERERFFKERRVEGTTLAAHMRGLSMDSRTGSSSRSTSTTDSVRVDQELAASFGNPDRDFTLECAGIELPIDR
ncbi:hypothetical protein ACLOJK_013891 [Asimina triloba]